jgi:hypothetical protein
MAEIKSTLDLVMERTRHMTLSPEERQAQKDNEIKQKLKGWVQKYQDEAISVQEFKREMSRLREDCPQTKDSWVNEEIIGRLDLDADNRMLLDLLQNACGMDTSQMDALIREYQESIREFIDMRNDSFRQALNRHRRISGTAIMANLENDKVWISQSQEIKAKYTEILKSQYLE